MEQERQRLAKISRVCLESLRHLVDGKFLVLDAYHLSLGQLEPEKIISRSLDRATTSKSYAQMLAVLGLIAELLLCSKTISQRDVYYALKHMFRNQSECNKIILDIGMLLQLKRSEMNIVPAAKGFVAGNLKFRFCEGKNGLDDSEEQCGWSDCSTTSRGGGTSISSGWTRYPDAQIYTIMPLNVKYLLVIEKEGIFHRLCEDDFHIHLPCIMVTGCGFPDIATRALVSVLHRRYPELIILGVCDYNPFGLALLLTFRLSSESSSFEGEGLQVPLRWLGVRKEHLEDIRVPAVPISPADLHSTSFNGDERQIFAEKEGAGGVKRKAAATGFVDDPSSVAVAHRTHSTTEPIGQLLATRQLLEGASYQFRDLDTMLETSSWTGAFEPMEKKAQLQAQVQAQASAVDAVVQPEDMTLLTAKQPTLAYTSSSRSYAGHFQHLSKADRGKIQSLLRSSNFPQEYVAPLLSMDRDGFKCELEALYSLGIDHVGKFIADAIRLRDYI